MSKRNLAVMAVSLVLLAAVGAACAKAAPTPTPTATPRPVATPTATPTPAATPTPTAKLPKRGGILRVPWSEPPHLDTHQSVIFDLFVTGNTSNYLVKMDVEGIKVGPDLAKSWSVSSDGTAITFPLVTNATFSDGKPVTCADIQYSYQRIMNPPTGMVSPRKGQFAAVQSVDCPDAYTAVFRLKYPWADALPNIADVFNVIYPKHVAEPNDKEGKFMRTTAVGSGAFTLKRFVVGEGAELERRANYWKPGLPYLDGINITSIQIDFQIWAAAFRGGRLDLMPQLDSPPVARELKATPGNWTVVPKARVLFVNFVPDQHPGSVWLDPEVRKAAALALVQEDFIAPMCDIAMVCWKQGLLPFDSPYALTLQELEQIPGYGKDAAARRAQAKEILARKTVPEFNIRTPTGLAPAFTDGSITACSLLLQVGFKCKFVGMEQGPYYDMVGKRQIPTGDAVVHSIAINSTTPDAILGQAYTPAGLRNYGDWKDPDGYFTNLFNQQSRELNEAKRKELAREYQTKFLQTYNHVLLGWRGIASAWWNYLHGYAASTISVTWLASWEEIWMDK